MIAALVVVAFGTIVAHQPVAARADLRLPRSVEREHALGKGYQLSHSLIAIGRGEIFGVGLGGSVEKLHWLPEAHTDFLLAVIGEEFGLVGVLLIIGLFLWLTRRVMHIAARRSRWTACSRASWPRAWACGSASRPSSTWA